MRWCRSRFAESAGKSERDRFFGNYVCSAILFTTVRRLWLIYRERADRDGASSCSRMCVSCLRWHDADARCTRDTAELSWKKSLPMERGPDHFRVSVSARAIPGGIYLSFADTNKRSWLRSWACPYSIREHRYNKLACYFYNVSSASESLVIFTRWKRFRIVIEVAMFSRI